MVMTAGPVWARGLALVAFLGTAACGGGDSSSSAPSTGSESSAGASAPAARTAPNRCPLTAEQVSAAVGSPVKGPDSICAFVSADDTKIMPRVLFNLQADVACNETMRAEMGYKDKVDGLGPAAYAGDLADGTHLLVCRGKTPFEINVDLADSSRARAAAAELARQVLAGS